MKMISEGKTEFGVAMFTAKGVSSGYTSREQATGESCRNRIEQGTIFQNTINSIEHSKI